MKAASNNMQTARNQTHLWFADFATENLRQGAVLEFTFFWKKTLRWEGRILRRPSINGSL